MRFPGFSGEWKKCSLGEIGSPYNGLTGKSGDDFGTGSPYITYKSVFDNTKIDLSRCELVRISDQEKKRQNQVKKGDIFFTISSETPEEVGMSSVLLDDIEDCYLNSFCFGFRLNVTTSLTEFLRFYLRSNNIRKTLSTLAQGSTRYNISKGEIMKMTLWLPSQQEQKKIADFFSLIEERISIQNKVIEDCITLEKEIQEQTFSQITAPLVPLSAISKRITERNTHWESNNVLTISAQEGLVSQLEYFNKSVASENLSNYYLLHNGDFAYNKSYSGEYPWGAIKHLEKYNIGVLSPLYFCFKPDKEKVDAKYLQFFFETKLWHKHIAEIAVEGARNHGLLNMAIGDFYTMPILLPTMREQQSIVERLSAFRQKRVTEESIYALLVQQKQHLLQKLFI